MVGDETMGWSNQQPRFLRLGCSSLSQRHVDGLTGTSRRRFFGLGVGETINVKDGGKPDEGVNHEDVEVKTGGLPAGCRWSF